MKINWKVRLKNKTFWLSVVPAVLLFIQVVAGVFGYTLDLGDLGNKLLAVVNAQYTFNKYTELWALSRGYSEKVSL